mgnify:CR=1 FL=1
MKNFNAIKILEEQQQEEDLMRRNLGKENYMASVYKFIDDYIKPRLEKLYSSNNNDFENFKQLKQLEIFTTHLVNDLGLMTDDEEYSMLNKDEIDFLGKDKKIKTQVANKICEYIDRRLNYVSNLEAYVDKYIVPLFKQLSDEKKITFDLGSSNDDVILISNNLVELAKKGVCENTYMSMAFPFTKNNYDEETLRHLDFLYSDDEDIKKEFATYLCNSFVENYNNLDLKNVERFNLIDDILKECQD